MINKDYVLALARQMHLDIDDLQMDELVAALKDSCLSIKKIATVEIADLVRPHNIVKEFEALRSDSERPSLEQAEALLNAPTKGKGFIMIP